LPLNTPLAVQDVAAQQQPQSHSLAKRLHEHRGWKRQAELRESCFGIRGH